MKIYPTGLYEAENNSWSVFINVMDNRVVFHLYSCTYDDLVELRDNFIGMIQPRKPWFTVLTDLTEFISNDPSATYAVSDIQRLLVDHGVAEIARVNYQLP